ncbi:hypothetical protein MCOR27_007447 [Pyricularia oryzae]|uniref:Sequence orphan n=5 Tax=Pyricularia TaxID=48558 RepID=A0ABQ8N8T4_PYRGI|nr:uncharacterized protein MGG_01705 [Pyricularia oryzae 70-15]ELQ40460.1 sequence orphan [Pyricularia oryzae Y34]KAH8839120.1 hypothetical protein MCOR01_008347 [Pyricularia oryzae]KAI6293146.1 hypothetical protein MCOR33_009362 [Pyricularia grisea]EHA54893.1 sequence orphan [Pyricularia oryzae 70-15]KAH9438962.1 hypothetical protein MCOR02_002548 [Pyricularia oryzae]
MNGNTGTGRKQAAIVAATAAAAVVSSPAAFSKPDMPTSSSKSQRVWNTKNLGWRLAADAISAAAAATMVAPLISIIDRSIMENASGRRSLIESVKSSLANLIMRPHTIIFARPFALICMTYGGTYLTANTLDTATSTVKNKPATLVTSGTAKFVASSTANTGLGIYKDQVFARMFGPPGATPRPVPLPSYLLFAMRDAVTIFASFNLPIMLAPYLNNHLSDGFKKHISGQTLAQFAAPAAIQIISTPPHLLGLDLYNRPTCASSGSPTWAERWASVRSNWAISSCARVCRIVPAFGIGGVVNFKVRRQFMEKLT